MTRFEVAAASLSSKTGKKVTARGADGKHHGYDVHTADGSHMVAWTIADAERLIRIHGDSIASDCTGRSHTMTGTFIAYEDGVATFIYGSGESPAAALQDASNYLEDMDDIVAAPCSQALYDRLATTGDMGDVVWELKDGTALLGSEIDA